MRGLSRSEPPTHSPFWVRHCMINTPRTSNKKVDNLERKHTWSLRVVRCRKLFTTIQRNPTYNPSQNILRPTPNGLMFCSFLWKHICSLRKGNNIYAPPPTKQCCFQMIIFTPKSPSITPTTLLCQGKGQKIDAVSEFCEGL